MKYDNFNQERNESKKYQLFIVIPFWLRFILIHHV